MGDKLASTPCTCDVHIHLNIPAFGVAKIISATSVILLPNTLNVVVTVTV